MGHTPATIFLLTICLFESSSAAGVRGITTRRLQNEPAFIHKGCSEKKGLRPEYTEHGMFGRGWYCSDGKMCGDDQNFEHTCDHAQIHRGCRHLVGLKPKYDHSTHTWYCSDRHHGHHQRMDLLRSIVTRNSASVTVIRCGTGMSTDTGSRRAPPLRPVVAVAGTYAIRAAASSTAALLRSTAASSRASSTCRARASGQRVAPITMTINEKRACNYFVKNTLVLEKHRPLELRVN